LLDADSWYCDSCATRHITQNKHNFVSYTKFANPETTVLGKKNVLMQGYGEGMINIHMFHNGMWYDATLKNVWYVLDASAHLFSIEAGAQNGYSTTLNEKEVVICGGDGNVAALGKLITSIYWQFGCVFHNTLQRVHRAKQAETLEVWHERGHQNKRHVMKVLKQHRIKKKWKQTKNFLMVML